MCQVGDLSCTELLPGGFQFQQQRSQQFRSVDRAAGFGRERGCLLAQLVGKRVGIRIHVEADAHHDAGGCLIGSRAFAENPADLLVAEEDVVRPFQGGTQPGEVPHDMDHGHPGGERNPGQPMRAVFRSAGASQDDGTIEIAPGRGVPASAEPSPTRSLLVRHDHRPVLSALLGESQSRAIGRGCLVQEVDRPTERAGGQVRPDGIEGQIRHGRRRVGGVIDGQEPYPC